MQGLQQQGSNPLGITNDNRLMRMGGIKMTGGGVSEGAGKGSVAYGEDQGEAGLGERGKLINSKTGNETYTQRED